MGISPLFNMAIGALNQHITNNKTEAALKLKTKAAKDKAAAEFAIFNREEKVRQQHRIEREALKGALEIAGNPDILDTEPIKINAVNYLKTIEGLPDFLKPVDEGEDDPTVVNPQSTTLEKGRRPNQRLEIQAVE